MPQKSTKAPDKKRVQAPGKLTTEQRLTIVRRIEAGEIQSDLAEEFGVSRQAVSQLMFKFRERGEESIAEPRRGRRPCRQLTMDEEEALHAIVQEHRTPRAAGLVIRAGKSNTWDDDAVKQLVVRECSFAPTKAIVTDLRAKWGLAGRGVREFSQDYYDYINSPVGKEVSRKNRELRAKQEEERRVEEERAKREQDGAGAPGEGEEEVEFSEAELAKIRRKMLAGGAIAAAPGQRTGKHSKARGAQAPKRKKRKKRK